ncbi:DUF624 domain-containing protein [Kineococcus sp. SYSU DK004]|uniref:DUF624 domain-containing protein n=1 Tax=Kineococcus sp. SYSU DK004 TaxID=3383125 RepID=UPI003D7E4C80
MAVDLESRTLQGLSGFLGMVALNVLFLLCCLPIVSIGAATSALFAVMLRYSDQESGNPVRDFLPALRAHGLTATAVSALLGLPALVFAFVAVFWFSTSTALGAALGTVAVLASTYLVAAFVYGAALIPRAGHGVRRTVRNALLLPGAEPLRTGGLLLVPATLVSTVVVLPPALVLLGTVGFSVSAYVVALVVRSAFDRHT